MQLFYWRQPFRSRAEADHVPRSALPGVVFVHGLMCNRGFWTPWMRRARALGLPCVAINLEPVFGDIDDYAPVIDAAVRRLRAHTGQAPLLVCHSMGGLAARAWLRSATAPAGVRHVVTIGSPHAGTWMARFGYSRHGRQMRCGNDWLQALPPAGPATVPVRFTCWYSDCDNLVFPSSTATLPGADNRFVAGQGHIALAFHPGVIEHTLALVVPGRRGAAA